MSTRLVSIFDPRAAVNPGTVVRLSHADESTPDWKADLGRLFMVGFYSSKDGIDCVWLVNDRGQYEQTTDREGLLRYFTIVKPSVVTDFYGRDSKLPRWPKQSA